MFILIAFGIALFISVVAYVYLNWQDFILKEWVQASGVEFEKQLSNRWGPGPCNWYVEARLGDSLRATGSTATEAAWKLRKEANRLREQKEKVEASIAALTKTP